MHSVLLFPSVCSSSSVYIFIYSLWFVFQLVALPHKLVTLLYESVLCNMTVSVLSDLALRQRAFSWPSVGSLTADSASVPATSSSLFLSARRSMSHYIQLLP